MLLFSQTHPIPLHGIAVILAIIFKILQIQVRNKLNII